MEHMTLTNGALRHSAYACGMSSNTGQPLVVCLHGFPDTARTFRGQLPALADAGYRAIAPMLRGYEPGSQPEDDDYTITTMARDVVAWLDLLGERQVHLVGHDWGAAITYAAGALAPERFASLTTIAVPHAARLSRGFWRHPTQLFNLWYMSFFQLRGIADWALEYNDWALLRRLMKSWSPSLELPDDEWRHLRTTFEAPGVKRAMLAYYRQNVGPGALLGWKNSEARKLTTVPVRTLVITGDEDGCMDSHLYDHVFLEQDFPAGFRIEQVKGAGHFAHLEQTATVNGLLLRWIAGLPTECTD